MSDPPMFKALIRNLLCAQLTLQLSTEYADHLTCFLSLAKKACDHGRRQPGAVLSNMSMQTMSYEKRVSKISVWLCSSLTSFQGGSQRQEQSE
jgi:hypothetical protein